MIETKLSIVFLPCLNYFTRDTHRRHSCGQVEVGEEFFSDKISELENLTKKIAHVIQQAIGLAVKVKLVEPKSIERSMGKAVRVIDKRKLV